MRDLDDLDLIIQEAISEEIESIVVPDMEDVWDNINTDIKNIDKENKENKEKYFHFNKRTASTVAAILILTTILVNMDDGYAYYRKILNFFSQTVGANKDIKLNYNKNTRTTPGIDEEAQVNLKTLPIEEAIYKSSFKIITPAYTPEGYIIEKVELTQFLDKTLMAELIYSKNDSDIIKMIQEPVIGDYSHTLQVDSNESTITQKKTNNIDYNIIEFKSGEVMIIWDMFEIKYTIVGLDKKELMKVALSIK
ncbi:DUF4367 domain-containing protein [Alkaliphilus sp. MSJ-5]|uniref:DUF4367 domain-containing protein n=1 Tax=Alkaliphilus flagellatus TaxID=2841507 RepID=A0ABS6G6K7_9FIRM|nr:DUF4367 domain-containing protein [Alkaliphilus flagellatus]MBU5677248.1 DUF4367 domain-containing protein [Alkaliphilus flagellatus]